MRARQHRRLAIRRGEVIAGLFNREEARHLRQRENGQRFRLKKLLRRHPTEDLLRQVAERKIRTGKSLGRHLQVCGSCTRNLERYRREAVHVPAALLESAAQRQGKLNEDQAAHLRRCQKCSAALAIARQAADEAVAARHVLYARIEQVTTDRSEQYTPLEQWHFELCADCRARREQAEAAERQRKDQQRRMHQSPASSKGRHTRSSYW